MKRAGRVALLLVLLAVLVLVPWAARTAVVDIEERLKPPKPDWQGVLSIGVVPSFPTVNLNGWLEAQGRAFEQQYGNVLISVREMTKQGVLAGKAAENLPELIAFGRGVFDDPNDFLCPLECDAPLRAEVKEEQLSTACPVAMGGYCLLGNRSLLDQMQWSPELTFAQTIALLEQNGAAIACPRAEYTSSLQALQAFGDTGSVTLQSELPHSKIWADFALEKKYVFYVSTQREVRRISVLQNAGKAFETVVLTPDAPAWTDQVLLMGMVNPQYCAVKTDAVLRARYAGRWIAQLLSDSAQQDLTRAGLFPVTDIACIYDADTPMGQIERSLRAQP